ncbi:MAG: phosphopantetheine-binding protein [Erysipelotrichaceae bacterium]|jgi:acyl carrier protein|nr:phosphopantetheine-binding protein [Erysipelotrichaceae bacterium]
MNSYLKDEILAILNEVCAIPVTQSDDLLDSGALDSYALMALIATLDERYGIEIQVSTTPSVIWRSVDGITGLVEDLMAQSDYPQVPDEDAPLQI